MERWPSPASGRPCGCGAVGDDCWNVGSGGGGRSKGDDDVVPGGAASVKDDGGGGGDDDVVIVVVVVVVVVRASADVSTAVTASAGGTTSDRSDITTESSKAAFFGTESCNRGRTANTSDAQLPLTRNRNLPGSTTMLAAWRHVASRSPVLSLRWAVTSRPCSRTMSSSSRVVLVENDEAIREARTWLTTFTIDALPRNGGTLKFSRSSGPGGQNVNKYASTFKDESPRSGAERRRRFEQGQLQGHLTIPHGSIAPLVAQRATSDRSALALLFAQLEFYHHPGRSYAKSTRERPQLLPEALRHDHRRRTERDPGGHLRRSEEPGERAVCDRASSTPWCFPFRRDQKGHGLTHVTGPGQTNPGEAATSTRKDDAESEEGESTGFGERQLMIDHPSSRSLVV